MAATSAGLLHHLLSHDSGKDSLLSAIPKKPKLGVIGPDRIMYPSSLSLNGLWDTTQPADQTRSCAGLELGVRSTPENLAIG